ncbi:MAG: glycosyltransferase family 2 protein [Candidatus Sumerlaeota bacterium]|nr:glycosyltransferase family 2 protein [Candidatus Sumerlaeota bacterium]
MHCPSLNDLPPPPAGKKGWPWTEEAQPLPERMPNGGDWPKISIVTPSFNQGRFIEATLRTVLLQGHPNLEYIVMDGGSTDESVEIIRKYAPWLTHWVSEPDRGQSHAINKGFAKATGEIYGWLNSDDLFLPGALRTVVAARAGNPTAVAWVGDCYEVTADQRVISRDAPKGLDKDSLADWGRNWFTQPSCLFSAPGWHKAGGLDETLHYAMDFDLWLKLAALGTFARIAGVLAAATIHPAAKTQALRPRMFADIVYVQLRHGYRGMAIEGLVKAFTRPPVPPLTTRVARRLRRSVSGFWSRVSGKTSRALPELSEILESH